AHEPELDVAPSIAPPPPQGRAAIWGFQRWQPAVARYWQPHGGEELAELTGPNDRQLVGDFMGTGHDQVLFLNYWGGTRRVAIADFYTNPSAPTLPYVEPWGNPLLNGWDDRQAWTEAGCWGDSAILGDLYTDDVAVAGDFLHRGHAQLLLLNRQPVGGRFM